MVQAYLTGPPRNGGGPVRVLGAFTGVMAAPGEVADVTLLVPARMFAAFDEEAGQWSCPGGVTWTEGLPGPDALPGPDGE